MTAFTDDHREAYGVEPICRVLSIAPSSYFERVAQRNDPARLSARAKRNLELKPEVARVFAENYEVYGVRKVAPDETGGFRCCPLHGRATDAWPWPARCHPWKACSHNGFR